MTTQEIITKAEKLNATKIRTASMFATEHENVRVRRNAMNLIIHGETSHRADPFHMTDEDKSISDALEYIADYREYTDRDTFTYVLDGALNLGNEDLYA